MAPQKCHCTTHHRQPGPNPRRSISNSSPTPLRRECRHHHLHHRFCPPPGTALLSVIHASHATQFRGLPPFFFILLHNSLLHRPPVLLTAPLPIHDSVSSFLPAHAELIPLAWFHTPLARDKFLTRFVDRPVHACEIVNVNSFKAENFPFLTYLLRGNYGTLLDLGSESYPQLVRMFYANARPTTSGSIITLECQ